MSGILTIDKEKLVTQANQIQGGVPTIAVVKNNAYNFGLELAVRAFLEAGITAFATTSLREAEEIREITEDSMVFLLNPTYEFEVVKVGFNRNTIESSVISLISSASLKE